MKNVQLIDALAVLLGHRLRRCARSRRCQPRCRREVPFLADLTAGATTAAAQRALVLAADDANPRQGSRADLARAAGTAESVVPGHRILHQAVQHPSFSVQNPSSLVKVHRF